ncbi:hypothetical protein [Amylolactobacillus amylophilus]|nr:hypothetical protein [Amylolactobacillus amylophilus]
MVGYAKRAQNIFESGNPDYEVEIRSQIMHQLNKNQQMIHSLKRSS